MSKTITKEQFHRLAKSTFKKLAEELELVPGTYDIRSNKAGPAVLGEVTLHAEDFYVQAGGSVNPTILYRTCKGRKDYCGGTNNFMPIELLYDMPRIAYAIRNLRRAS